MSRTHTNPRILEPINTTDVLGLIDSSTGKIQASLMPSIALGDYLGPVASEAAMLLLGAEPGDTCTRTEFTPDQIWLCLDTPSNLAANWAAVSGYVVSVNGQTGTVVLTAADVGALTQATADTLYQTIATPTAVSSTPYTYASGTKPVFSGTITWTAPAASTAQRYFFHVDSGSMTFDLDGTDTFQGSTSNPVFVANEGGEISTTGNGDWRFD